MNDCEDCKKRAKIFTALGIVFGIAVGAGIVMAVNKRGK